MKKYFYVIYFYFSNIFFPLLSPQQGSPAGAVPWPAQGGRWTPAPYRPRVAAWRRARPHQWCDPRCAPGIRCEGYKSFIIAPLKPLRDDSVLRALSSLRALWGASEAPPLCRETQSLGQQMLNATVGINGLIRVKNVAPPTLSNSPVTFIDLLPR